jgi:hypothetical protein
LVATPLQRLFERRLNKSGSKFGPTGEEPHGDVSQAPSASSCSPDRIRKEERRGARTNVPTSKRR